MGVSAVVKLEECIEKWEKCLPQCMTLDNFNNQTKSVADNILYRQMVLLRLRYVATLFTIQYHYSDRRYSQRPS